MKNSLLLFIACILSTAIFAQNPPKRELRGGWIATFVNIDWPKSRNLTAAQQQAALNSLLDLYQQTRLNAVYLQVRSQCDALYDSPYEPWTADLTGVQGNNPGYDPLAYAIEQAHARSLELHAWFNPYRALSSATTANLANLHPSHVINQHPDWIMNVTINSNNAQQRLLNPGLPQVRDYVIKVVMDVVRRYDVDGIHFDDYFYTNPATTTYNDDAAFMAYNPHGLTKENWRRANVDSLIKRLGDSIRSEKPWVKFGISPSGIWMSQGNHPEGSATSAGALQHYKDLFANSRLWQQEGWVDYLIPQIYWWMGQPGSDYSILAPWWSQNAFDRHMYIGLAGYKVGDPNQGQFNTNASQINNQVRLNRSLDNVLGQVVYNTTSLVNNKLSFTDSLRDHVFIYPALHPPMPWKDDQAPPPPVSTAASVSANLLTLQWQAPETDPSDPNRVWQYAVYRSSVTPVDISLAENLLAIVPPGQTSYSDLLPPPGQDYYYVVTSLDRLHNESEPGNQVAWVDGALPIRLVSFAAVLTGPGQASIRWQVAGEEEVLRYELERSTDGGVHFSTIASMLPNRMGTTASYSHNDAIFGKTWYRLRIRNLDGQISMSPLAMVAVQEAVKLAKVFPTQPGAGSTVYILPGNTNIPLQYQLVTSQGSIAASGVVPAGQIQIGLPLDGMAKGIYYLVLRQHEKTETIKLVR